MDLYSRKRPVSMNSATRKGSSPATRDTDETIQFCNRIGCSGRLNLTQHTQNYLRPSSRSSHTNVKKHELNTLEVKLKSKSRDTESNKGVKPVGRTVEVGSSSGTKIRKVNGQTGSVDHGRRKESVKKRSTEARGNKMSVPSLDEESGSLSSSVRTRRSVNQNGNNSSSIESTRVTPDNVDAIANVLLALERIDQEEGLTYDQILGNPFLGGFNLYDQHRDMRLDIDNMSYEELLALEEEMGSVSTALSEEELSKFLRISIYKPLHIKDWRTRGDGCLDDMKCSICQEEFIAGDEIGRVGCDHGYHAVCINQWLRLKNWCPICKVSVKPSNS